MTKPEDFIMNTDYVSLPNDDKDTVAVTIPAGVTIASGSSANYTQDVAVGSKGSYLRVRLNIAGVTYPNLTPGTTAVIYQTNGSMPSLGVTGLPYAIAILVYRISATHVRIHARIVSTYPATFNCNNPAITATATINTYISPFV